MDVTRMNCMIIYISALFRKECVAVTISCSTVTTNTNDPWPRSLRRGPAAFRLLGLRVRIPPRYGCLSLVSVVCCKTEVSAMCRSLIQRRPTDCVVPECDREASIIRGPCPNGGCCSMGGKKTIYTATVHLYLKCIYSQIGNSKGKVSPTTLGGHVEGEDV
jgi:hypothetical protein